MEDLQTLESRKALGKKYGTKYLIDPALVCAVVEHESSWNPWAMRYEPMFFDHYIQPLLNNNTIHTMTEAIGRATSYGLMQTMGQVAREFGFQGKFLCQLCDPEISLDFGCKKLVKCLDSSNGDIEKALLSYNGGGDPNYPNAVMQLMQKYC